MTKTYCDICGKEIKSKFEMNVRCVPCSYADEGDLLKASFNYDLCRECADEMFYQGNIELLRESFIKRFRN